MEKGKTHNNKDKSDGIGDRNLRRRAADDLVSVPIFSHIIPRASHPPIPLFVTKNFLL